MKCNKIVLMAAMLVSVHAFSMQYLKDNATSFINFTHAKASACGQVISKNAQEYAPMIADKAKDSYNWASEKVVEGAHYVAENAPVVAKQAKDSKYAKIGAAVVAGCVIVVVAAKILIKKASRSAHAKKW